MVETDALFRMGDAAEEAGDFSLAFKMFERGASLGDSVCLCRLAYMIDVGIGVDVDKQTAMRYYQRAWRLGREVVAGSNIAILYRERSNYRAMFQWWRRVADTGDGSALLEVAKSYLSGKGVRKNPQAALRCLAAAADHIYITEAERDEVRDLLATLGPRGV